MVYIGRRPCHSCSCIFILRDGNCISMYFVDLSLGSFVSCRNIMDVGRLNVAVPS